MNMSFTHQALMHSSLDYVKTNQKMYEIKHTSIKGTIIQAFLKLSGMTFVKIFQTNEAT